MALKQEDKPMLPAQPLPQGHVQCADEAACKKPGRLRTQSMPPKALVCVEHYYARLARGER